MSTQSVMPAVSAERRNHLFNQTTEQITHAQSTPFVWGVGIECSFLPHLNVDQFEWTQHNRFWRDDFKMIREHLGVTHMRYALPWHQIETKPGVYDWSLADERMAYCQELGIELMMDVMHFGTPTWLPQAVGDPQFPESLERFTVALVERYRHQVKTWCPFNEPLVSALFSGDFGFWPPFGRKWRGYMPVLSRIVQGVHRSIAAIRRVHPEATVLLCDALENFQSKAPDLQNEVAMRNMRRFVVLDLLAGRVDHYHPLFAWLTGFGFSELDLDYLRRQPQLPDVIGIDYYPHSDWQLETHRGSIRQRRADSPLGIYTLGRAVYDRYGLPIMVTETSIEGPPIAREMWLQTMTDQIRQLRDDGVPMAGLIWWPVFDQLDWDGALTHRVGKIHRVGLFTLNKQADGTLKRSATPLAKIYRDMAAAGDEHVGTLGELSIPAQPDDPQLAPLYNDAAEFLSPATYEARHSNGASNGAAHGGQKHAVKQKLSKDSVSGLAVNPELAGDAMSDASSADKKSTDRYGILVFSHLRWGFVWQRPQQYLSRFARFHPVLFVEEPFFDLPDGCEPRLDFHRVLPNVSVITPHCSSEMAKDLSLPQRLREWVKQGLEIVNQNGAFDQPLLWYYSPMDSAWSLGHFPNRGVVYDCMDELSQFTGAPKELVENERRLMDHADVVFTGGYELWTKKSAVHPNAHFYGCGVEFDHFNQAQNADTSIPPDIDFLPRPILGWFGVVDERVDYHLLAEVARLRPDWSIAIVGPVVKVDPNLLPHAPNLHWLGSRDYSVLPNYCRAFDVCMMAFAINKATEFINPTKALEYLATGKPVVSTAVKDVVRQYSDLVEIATSPQDFIRKAEQLLDNPRPDRIEQGLALARKMSWEGHVTSMRNNIKQAIENNNRRSSHIKPIADPAPGYFFKHTPGS
jgi:beta-glucosidase/6-phospho-beta-glucosidase/beta-galactosidase/glycosyltransferase involved in cell wall biosynthesis